MADLARASLKAPDLKAANFDTTPDTANLNTGPNGSHPNTTHPNISHPNIFSDAAFSHGALAQGLAQQGFLGGWIACNTFGKEFRDAFLDALKDYSQGLDDLVPFLRRYGRLIGAGDVLRSVQFHEIIYERLFSAKGLDPKALGLDGYFPGTPPLETPGVESSDSGKDLDHWANHRGKDARSDNENDNENDNEKNGENADAKDHENHGNGDQGGSRFQEGTGSDMGSDMGSDVPGRYTEFPKKTQEKLGWAYLAQVLTCPKALHIFTITPQVHQAILDKNVGYLKKTAQFLESLSPWEPLYQIGRSWGRFFLGWIKFWDQDTTKGKLGPGDKKIPGDCGLTKAEQRREEEVQASSGLLRITFTAQSIWNRIPFTTLFGLTVLLPVAYNMTDKYVMSRANFGRYLSNNIRLAYEDFYYTLNASKNVSSKEIKDMANHLLGTINKRYDAVPGLQLSDYGEDNRTLIVYFIFALRVFALTTLSNGKIPDNLPRPQDIDKVAAQIQKFMEQYAWRSFLWPKSMDKTKIIFPQEYKKVLNAIRNNKDLWGIFSRECNEKCLNELEALIQ
jgi:hypothetical protein